MLSILMTSLTDTPLILQWEVWLGSLLGLKELRSVPIGRSRPPKCWVIPWLQWGAQKKCATLRESTTTNHRDAVLSQRIKERWVYPNKGSEGDKCIFRHKQKLNENQATINHIHQYNKALHSDKHWSYLQREFHLNGYKRFSEADLADGSVG